MILIWRRHSADIKDALPDPGSTANDPCTSANVRAASVGKLWRRRFLKWAMDKDLFRAAHSEKSGFEDALDFMLDGELTSSGDTLFRVLGLSITAAGVE